VSISCITRRWKQNAFHDHRPDWVGATNRSRNTAG
jgi:Protein of unknown function (DUF5131)